MLGQYDKALPYGLDCIHLDPKAAICYSDLIHEYAALHRLDDAKSIYQTALSLHLDHPDLHQARYAIAFLESDSAEMARQLAWSSGKPGAESLLSANQANTEAFYGRLQNAHAYANRAIDSASRDGAKDQAARFKIYDAFRAAMFGEVSAARRDAADALKLAPFLFVRNLAAVTLASSGDIAQAEKIIADLAAHYPDDTLLQGFWLPSIHAAIELQRHRPDKAIEALRFAEALEKGEHIVLLPAYLRGQAYLALHDGVSASREFKKLTDAPGLVQNSTLAALAPLGLARALALSARLAPPAERAAFREQAIAAYTRLLAQWKSADPTLVLLRQARIELGDLRNSARPGSVNSTSGE
jgi:eukaryotic-like serine/threonine-protein kinase